MNNTEIRERNLDILKMLGYNYKNIDVYHDWHWIMHTIDFIEQKNMTISIINNECKIIDNENNVLYESKINNSEKINKMLYENSIKYDNKRDAIFITISDYAKTFNLK